MRSLPLDSKSCLAISSFCFRLNATGRPSLEAGAGLSDEAGAGVRAGLFGRGDRRGVVLAGVGGGAVHESGVLQLFRRARPKCLCDAAVRAAGEAAPPGGVDAESAAEADRSEPLLRFVDLSTTHIAKAQRMTLPYNGGGVPVGPGSGVGDVGGTGVLVGSGCTPPLELVSTSSR